LIRGCLSVDQLTLAALAPILPLKGDDEGEYAGIIVERGKAIGANLPRRSGGIPPRSCDQKK